ncbi:hypothetical protein KR52_07210 [Synechococcus sp. KORDI-52]|nr:hypothetical protein KR52_07210 [Synechococcus sp. KORDI-52]
MLSIGYQSFNVQPMFAFEEIIYFVIFGFIEWQKNNVIKSSSLEIMIQVNNQVSRKGGIKIFPGKLLNIVNGYTHH